jgi:hypothetical protein
MAPGVRKLALTVHVTSSVGWLGAVVAVLVLAVAGMTSGDVLTVRGVYLAMELMGRLVLVPLALASLLSGLVQSLGTAWGLFRHYWVLLKLLITVLATAVLLMYMETLGGLADVAAGPADQLELLRTPSVVLHAGAALLLLLVATILALYKPRGRTRYGRRNDERTSVSPS